MIISDICFFSPRCFNGFYQLFYFLPSRELKYGIPVFDENENRLGESANAAKQAIVQVVVSRIGMAVPAMGNFIISAACLIDTFVFYSRSRTQS